LIRQLFTNLALTPKKADVLGLLPPIIDIQASPMNSIIPFFQYFTLFEIKIGILGIRN